MTASRKWHKGLLFRRLKISSLTISLIVFPPFQVPNILWVVGLWCCHRPLHCRPFSCNTERRKTNREGGAVVAASAEQRRRDWRQIRRQQKVWASSNNFLFQKQFSGRVQRSSVGWALGWPAVGQARVQSSGSEPQGDCPIERTSNEENGESPRRMEMDECTVWMWLGMYEKKTKINKKSDKCQPNF